MSNLNINFYKIANKFHILSNSLRLRIIYFLNDVKEANVTSIVDHLKVGQSFLSQQLKILYNANIISRHKIGKNVYYSLNNPKLIIYLNELNNLGLKELKLYPSYKHSK